MHLKDTWFIPGKSPITTCQIHRAVTIDVKTGRRGCSDEVGPAITRVYEFWPSDLERLFLTDSVARRTPPPVDRNCGDTAANGAAPIISSPARGITYSADQDHTEIPFTAVSDADSRIVYWFVDSAEVGTSRPGESLFWKARPGSFIVRAVDEQGRAAAEEIIVTPGVK
jgi:penicillin-binding protein 1C